jgi:hypothetical protein
MRKLVPFIRFVLVSIVIAVLAAVDVARPPAQAVGTHPDII